MQSNAEFTKNSNPLQITDILRNYDVNPHLHYGRFHPYQLDESISNFRGLLYFFIFVLFQIEIPVSKQWIPWSDAAFSDLGLHCLLMSQKWDARLIWVK